jgi:tRNAThr (cytosine32-N3)-methyltransferase
MVRSSSEALPSLKALTLGYRWDLFYKNNKENFFKNRKWLRQEFPIIAEAIKEDAAPTKVVELGCGAGNTMFPILAENKNPNFHIRGSDFSAKAVSLVKSQPLYREQRLLGTVSASVYDMSTPDTLPEGIGPESVDVVFMIFVFSALAPSQWADGLNNVRRMLKKGGKVLFRDYGHGDLAQVRFKAGRYLDENFYVRGDGTRVYFFKEAELRRIFTGAPGDPEATDGTASYGGFKIESFGVDKRLLVNRKKQIKMYRCWMQAVFEKI